MKTVTATEANRDFSKLLEEVSAGDTIGITKRGKMIATINPVQRIDEETARAEVRKHLAWLRQQPVLGIPRGGRDELYED
jgi:prevent-host-death family protein